MLRAQAIDCINTNSSITSINTTNNSNSNNICNRIEIAVVIAVLIIMRVAVIIIETTKPMLLHCLIFCPKLQRCV